MELSAIRKAAGTVERDAEMIAQSPSRPLTWIWIGIVRSNNYGVDGGVGLAAWRQPGSGQRSALGVAKGKEERHFQFDMRFKPDRLFEENHGDRLEALRRPPRVVGG